MRSPDESPVSESYKKNLRITVFLQKRMQSNLEKLLYNVIKVRHKISQTRREVAVWVALLGSIKTTVPMTTENQDDIIIIISV